ncbi:MAG TPA: 30S ribosomal protein S16 [Candidatus Saccharimonadales bacterium]|nr:30S ribosomal protein S16 [Candidatus Saccharimonadales bacterium]
MLAIRMQRTGRKGQAQFRVIVQDSRRSPSSGNIVELLGNYDPHTKVANLEKERILFYLNNGAQPSDRVLRILTSQKVQIPKWVEKITKKKSATKNPTKLRKNQPKVETVVEEVIVAEPEVKEEPAEETAVEEAVSDEIKAEDQVVETTEEVAVPEPAESETTVEVEK